MMFSIAFLFLAAEAAAKAVPATPHDWLPTIGAIIVSVITGLFSWWKSRPKGRNDQFKTFMDESAEFREEIRKERENLKNELKHLGTEKQLLQKRIAENEEELEKCERLTEKYKREIETIKGQLGTVTENRRYKDILNSIPTIVWVSDPKGNVNYYNARAFQFSGVPYMAAKDFKYIEHFHPDDVPIFLKIWGEAMQSGQRYFCEYRVRKSEGEYRWHIASGVPVVDSEGTIKEWIGICTDVHDYKMKLLRKKNAAK